MALWRVLRCHPLASGGLDPVVKDPLAKISFVDPTPSASSGLALPQSARNNGVPRELNCAFTDEEMSY